jgi:hypothetical protein
MIRSNTYNFFCPSSLGSYEFRISDSIRIPFLIGVIRISLLRIFLYGQIHVRVDGAHAIRSCCGRYTELDIQELLCAITWTSPRPYP